MIYRVSIKSSPDYKHLLQENYVEYKHIFITLFKLVSKILCHVVYCYVTVAYVSITRSFLVINVCSQGKNLCTPCIISVTVESKKVDSDTTVCTVAYYFNP